MVDTNELRSDMAMRGKGISESEESGVASIEEV
jgi:hypothetical protein